LSDRAAPILSPVVEETQSESVVGAVPDGPAENDNVAKNVDPADKKRYCRTLFDVSFHVICFEYLVCNITC